MQRVIPAPAAMLGVALLFTTATSAQTSTQAQARAQSPVPPPVSAASASAIQGCWNGSMQLGMFGRVPVRLNLTVARGVLEGTFQGPGGAARPIERGRVTSNRFEFEVPARHGRMRFSVTASADTLRGEIRVERQGRLPFDARRC